MAGCERRGLSLTSVREGVLAVIFVALIFQSELQNLIGGVCAYIDEVVAVCLAMWAIALCFKHRIASVLGVLDRYALLALLSLCICGFAGNAINEVQADSLAILIDFFTCIKFFLAFWALKIIFGCSDFSDLLDDFARICRIVLTVLFVLMVINQFIGIGMSQDSRYGIECFMFLSGHASNFAASIVIMLVILMVNPHKNRVFIFMALILLCSTMRFKAIGFVAIIAIELVFFPRMKKISFGFVLFAVGVAVIASFSQIEAYFLDETKARSVLLRESFHVANLFAPLGAGFAGYGSFVTLSHYVPLYSALGFENVYGLSWSDPSYLADSFWPIIIGQFGYLGLLLFVILLILFIRIVLVMQRRYDCPFWAVLAGPTYLLITSTSEPAFFNFYAVSLAFVLVVVLMAKYEKVKK